MHISLSTVILLPNHIKNTYLFETFMPHEKGRCVIKKSIRMRIDGMTCINCQEKIERALNSANGVIRAGE